jgi:hypothetical protein
MCSTTSFTSNKNICRYSSYLVSSSSK